MLEISRTKEELKQKMNLFIWDFKIFDNIEYNLDILFDLIEDYNLSCKNLDVPTRNYKKPISLITISIIEGIMVDFLYRLYLSTNHFPDKLKDQENIIKSKLAQETKKSKYVDSKNREYWIQSLKNFNFITMIEFYEELKLLGDIKKNYEFLTKLVHFRNRIHIKNYFNNFEKNESVTFSEIRVQKTLKAMVWFFEYFEKNYPRPWPKSIL